MRNLSVKILLGIILVGLVRIGNSQILKNATLFSGSRSTRGPASNAINDILVVKNDVWVGAKGLSRTSNNGESWITYTQEDGLGRGGVSALAMRDGVIWVSMAYDTTVGSDKLPVGGGLSYSTDSGKTWHWIPQPVDPEDVMDYQPTASCVQNLIYDIALTDSAVWIASFLGGLRKSTNLGETWQVVTVDGYPFNARGPLTHQVFSVVFDGQALWAGTAGGIHKSTDGGRTWTTFNHQNQLEGISGNFVVAIGHQHIGGNHIVWAATIEAVDSTEYRAVSKTEDGGLTWMVTLEDVFTYNFAFDSLNSAVYVATDGGLYKSLDLGKTWAVFSQIVDGETGEGVYTTEVYSVRIGPEHSLWAGTGDGLVRSLDDGMTWKIFHAFQIPGEDGTPKTYAYPNPFSPLRHNLIDGDGHVRLQYRTTVSTRVTVRVYDFGMNLVRTVVEGKDRSLPGDYAEVWDGKNSIGEMVANGVYFYKITLTGDEPLWGKVLVVN